MIDVATQRLSGTTTSSLMPPLVHPALNFHETWAAIGILTGPKQQHLVTSEFEYLSVEELCKTGRIYPAPMTYPDLMGRWSSEDVRDFCSSRKAPSVGELLLDIQSVLTCHVEAPSLLSPQSPAGSLVLMSPASS